MAKRKRRAGLRARLSATWVKTKESLWFIPALLTAASAALALLTLSIDDALGEERLGYTLIFGGGAEGARGVLGAIAGSILTVTGVIFSVTIIALQLASTQYTPRVLRNFTADRGNQLVLGVFIGTFTYTLLVLRAVQSGEDNDVSALIPSISVTVAVLLALVSVGFFIFFVNHVARSIQVSEVIQRITADALHLVDRLFPAPIAEPAELRAQGSIPEEPPGLVLAESGGYLQAVDEGVLWNLEPEGAAELNIRMEVCIGDFILPGALLASVWPQREASAELARGVRDAFICGPERNLRQDLEFAILELLDIAVKALSPSVNDPTTALNALDRVSEVLVHMGRREPPPLWRKAPERPIFLLAKPQTFERAVNMVFDQLRHFGGGSPTMASHMIEVLSRVAALVPEDRRPVLDRQLRAVLRASRAKIEDPASQAVVRRARDQARRREARERAAERERGERREAQRARARRAGGEPLH